MGEYEETWAAGAPVGSDLTVNCTTCPPRENKGIEDSALGKRYLLSPVFDPRRVRGSPRCPAAPPLRRCRKSLLPAPQWASGRTTPTRPPGRCRPAPVVAAGRGGRGSCAGSTG